MIIATFTSGSQTIIGCRKEGEKDDLRIVDSRILFENPNEFVSRFSSLLFNLFGIEALTKSDKLVFALSGNVNSEEREIIESYVINKISTSKLFDGFDFARAFGKMVGKENIFLLNDSHTVATGVASRSEEEIKLPALLLYINEDIGISIIKDSGIINYDSSLVPIERLGNKTARELLCDIGIDDSLFENSQDVFKEYTYNLSEVIKHTIARGGEDGFAFKKVFIHSNKCEFIIENSLRSNLDGIDISIFNGNEAERYIPVEGVFDSLSYLLGKSGSQSSASEKNLAMISTTTFAGSVLGAGTAGKIGLAGLAARMAIPIVGHLIAGIAGLAIAKPLVKKMVKDLENNKIAKVVYCSSSGEQIKAFEKFEEFTEHWKATKPIAYGKNYYDMLYSDATKVKVELDSLNSITDLMKYKF